MKKKPETDEKSFLDYMLESRKKTKWQKIWWWTTVIFWHRSIGKIPDFFREIKWAFQRTFRSNHASDRDIWGLADHLTPILLGKLKAFRASPLHGYPAAFCDWDPEDESGHGHVGMTKEDYDKAKAEGHYVGGGFDAWLEALDKMVFAFDFLCYYEDFNEKRRDAMLARHGLEYPHKKIPENRKVHYAYKSKDHYMSSHLPPDDPDNKDREFLGEEISYYNFDLERKYYEKVQEGLELFAKYYLSLWD